MGKIKSIDEFCKGDGRGLTGGMLTDMFLIRFLENKLSEFKECHNNEADCTILGKKLSLKKVKGKSSIALNWSKNSTEDRKEKFIENMMIIVLKSGKWWQAKGVIPAGIYCKEHVKLSHNNKTNALIHPMYLYEMIRNSIANELYIELPKETKIHRFDITLAFE